MKLRNKKTREIIELLAKPSFVKRNDDYLQSEVNTFNSLAELNEEWEDYEEPKEYWFIRDHTLSVGYSPADNNATAKFRKEIVGNYFETKEEAEQALEKLKAWKRLKDYYIKFRLDFVKNTINFTYRLDGTLHSAVNEERIIFEDMKTIFGGEDDKK